MLNSALVWSLLLHFTVADDLPKLVCSFSQREVHLPDLQNLVEGSNSIINDGDLMQCSETSHHCYAFWREEIINDANVTTVMSQGCWEVSNQGDECSHHSCIARKRSPKALNNTRFCCCQGNLCNLNFSYQYDPNLEYQEALKMADVHGIQPNSATIQPLVIVMCAILSLIIILAIIFVMYRFWLQKQKPLPDSLKLVESSNHVTPTVDLSSLSLQEIIGQGRYGNVWRGTLQDEVVAVKVFPAHYKQYFLNERDIYTLHFMEHPNILKYYGSEQKLTKDMSPEYLLMLSYMPNGCLQSYLKEWTVGWADCVKMMSGVARGLSHLHGDILKGDKYKPCISHRDLSSRNVLVTVDRNTVICDLGFALKIVGSSYFMNGEEQHAETRSLTDVGTLRYMSPEVLEGAVNLRDCESSLKEIDIYALGLVMWEIATRCYDLYQGAEVPCYKMPFEAETGSHPTFEEMQILVSRHKARPLFPDVWKDYNPGIKLLKETIEECWDQDAEARLTAMCVVERLLELPQLWDRFKGSVQLPKTVPPSLSEVVTYNPCERLSLHLSSYSDKTVDTYLSPDDTINSVPGKNELLAQIQVPLPSLQPHHGHNPCMERNTVQESSEDSKIYCGRSLKHLNSLPCENAGMEAQESTALLPPSPLSPAQYSCQVMALPPKILNDEDKKHSWFEKGYKKFRNYKAKLEGLGKSSYPKIEGSGKQCPQGAPYCEAQSMVVSVVDGQTKTVLERPTFLSVTPAALKPCKVRVSTPYGVSSSRFSLCDDSIMLGYDPSGSSGEVSESRSVPDHINAYLEIPDNSGVLC